MRNEKWMENTNYSDEKKFNSNIYFNYSIRLLFNLYCWLRGFPLLFFNPIPMARLLFESPPHTHHSDTEPSGVDYIMRQYVIKENCNLRSLYDYSNTQFLMSVLLWCRRRRCRHHCLIQWCRVSTSVCVSGSAAQWKCGNFFLKSLNIQQKMKKRHKGKLQFPSFHPKWKRIFLRFPFHIITPIHELLIRKENSLFLVAEI